MKKDEPVSFNLLRQPWLPCKKNDGSVSKVGLIELFRKSDEFIDLSIASPTCRIGIYRLLISIVMRSHKPVTARKWIPLWNAGLDKDSIISYLEKWEDRFDLFSEKYPFYQRPGLDLGDKQTPLTKLSPEFTADRKSVV